MDDKKEYLFKKYPELKVSAYNDVAIMMDINGYVNGLYDETTCINRIISKLNNGAYKKRY